MRTLKISLLVFILSITVSAQSQYLGHNEKILQNPYLSHTTDSTYLDIQQEIISIINKVKVKQNDQEYYLIDSLISESVSGAKVKFLFEYNIDDKIIERTGFVNDINGNWQIIEKDEYFYDIFKNLIREIYFDWNNVTWDSSTQFLYTYNQDNNLISTTLQSYVTSNWENEVRTNYTYDQAGNEITSLTEL